jgi:hypothetical protein
VISSAVGKAVGGDNDGVGVTGKGVASAAQALSNMQRTILVRDFMGSSISIEN